MGGSSFATGDRVHVRRGGKSFPGVVKSISVTHIREDEVGYEHQTQQVTVEVTFTDMAGQTRTSEVTVSGSALRRRFA